MTVKKSKSILLPIYTAVLFLFFFSHSFATEKTSFSEYQTFALLSHAAYQNKKHIYEFVEKDGWVISQYRTIPDIEVLYFLISNHKKKEQIIIVRGTANIENALVDLSHKLLPSADLNIKLHEGFAFAAKNIFNKITPHLKKNYRISTTGHSLGGSVALIIAMHLEQSKYRLNKVITFGQPKVTNMTGALKYQHIALTRVVTPKDLVPLVPPFDAMDINNLDIYWHLGTELILLSGLQYAEISGLDSMLRATNILTTKIDQQNVENHRMTLYIELIEGKLHDSVKVKFKKQFNFFKLFSGS